ncbi:hypothetical protein KP509_14G032800 [Ceratopteris richardii]|uniref:RNA-binding protein 48 n=1 Tax=Ceratopteris richardii TaxID=49495 RepID=A0A8T2T6W9_CERRI|nr:hypothetical protein KP509_14G032800 [Ceratopteris richardii]
MSAANNVRVYTVSDESKYLIVKNVPALGCIEELVKLFGSYGPIEEYRLMDEEDCEPYTDIYWIKFMKISNARFAKRKLDNFNFLGNLIEVNYAPTYETVLDTKEKLEERSSILLRRIQSLHQGSLKQKPIQQMLIPVPLETVNKEVQMAHPDLKTVDSGKDSASQSQYFPMASMNATVHAVRQKLNQISEIGENLCSMVSINPSTELQQLDERGMHGVHSSKESNPTGKRPRIDGRRRI